VRLSDLLEKYEFVNLYESQNYRTFARKMKDGGSLSISLGIGSYTIPRAFCKIDDYEAIEIACIKNGEFYEPTFVAYEFNPRGILSYFPIAEFENLLRMCIEEV